MLELHTERLLIRPFVMEDLLMVHDLLDKDLEWAGPGFTLEQRREALTLQVQLARWDLTGRIYGHRAIVLKDSGEVVGLVHLHPEVWSPEWKRIFWPILFPGWKPVGEGCLATLEVAIGYGLSSKHRGQGLATEAVRAAVDHAFGELRLCRLFAVTDAANQASERLMRRIGMRVARNPDHACTYPAVAGVLENPSPLL